ncbi:hypothetical protein XENOCAPTIV_026231, partial [Xenoophorus captivus]
HSAEASTNVTFVLLYSKTHLTAGPKGNEDQKRLTVHYTASQHYHENVFMEGSRPQYLEDLHTEAQEGLKILQQEEQDSSSKDRGGSLESRPNTTNDTTATSAKLNRPGLTHQGSTFKPLNPVKRLDRSRKRNRRTTIMGIPNQVQKELALNRSSTFQPLVSTQLPNHENHDGDSQSSVVIIPTVNGGNPLGKKEGARVHLSELEGPVMSISPQATYLSTIIPNAVLPASVEVIEIDRSRSRTHGSSVSAVSKSSLTSEESAVSPLLSRRSDGDGSQTNSSNYNSALMPRSASGSNWSESQSSKTIISDSSVASSNRADYNVQESQIEESGDGQDLNGLCSSVNALSSLHKIEVNATEAEYGHGATQSLGVGDQAKTKRNCIHSLSVTKTKQPPTPPRRTNSLHGKKMRSESKIVVEFEDFSNPGSGEVKGPSENIVAEDGIKLHAINANLNPEPLSNSTGPTSANSSSTHLSPLEDSSNQSAEAAASQQESDPSSPQKTPSDGGKFERTMSPSSGYSSQSGTPTLSPKEISPHSTDKEMKKKPIKPERSASRASSSEASPSSSLTSLSSGTSEPANADVPTCSTTLPPRDSSTTKEVTPSSKPLSLRAEVQELFNIPPPPKVKAPHPPPPETWAHSRRTVELLCGPCSNVSKTPQKPAEIQGCEEKQIDVQREPRNDTQVTAENQTNQENPVLEMSSHLENPVIKVSEDDKSGLKVKECSDTEPVQKNEKDSTEANSTEESSICIVKKPDSQETIQKKEPPPVMKKPMKILFRDETERPLETLDRKLSWSAATEVHLFVEDHTAPSENSATVPGDKSEMEKSEVQSMQTLKVDVPKMSKLSPPPTPPPAYQPTPPPMRKPAASQVSPTPNESEKEHMSDVVDSCWPPPPPPLEGESAFDGGDELDFPLPPPPSIRDDVEDPPVTSVLNLADNKSVNVEQVSKLDSASETSSQDISCVTDTVSPSPIELPPVPPVTRAESPMSTQVVVPSSSYLRRNSLKPEDQSPSALPGNPQPAVPTSLPKAPPAPMENLTSGVNFRRQPSGAHRDSRSKELLCRHKSAPVPKEDANIPLVTPSLLQMVRLRTVSMTEDQVQPSSEDTAPEGTPVLENCPVSSQGSQNIPPKPIRKSLSVKTPPQTVKTSTVTMSSPSVRLQEAIRIKTAAMSSRDCLPPRLGVKSPTYSCTDEPGVQSLKPLEGCDFLKSPASTASFIFSRSTKKVVIEPVATSSSEAQANLKQSLAAELRQVSDQTKAGALSNDRARTDRIPPPIAKKPTPGSTSPLLSSHSCSAKMELRIEGNKAPGAAQHVALPKTSKWNNCVLLSLSLTPLRSYFESTIHTCSLCRAISRKVILVL